MAKTKQREAPVRQATQTVTLEELKVAAARRKQQREREQQQLPCYGTIGLTVYELLDAGFVYVEVEQIRVTVFNDELRAFVPNSPTYMVHRSVLATGREFSIDSSCVDKISSHVRLNMGGGETPYIAYHVNSAQWRAYWGALTIPLTGDAVLRQFMAQMGYEYAQPDDYDND